MDDAGNLVANVPGGDQLLTASEVARLFRVDPRTVTRWAVAGQLSCIWTLRGHRRFREAEVHALLVGGEPQAPRGSPSA